MNAPVQDASVPVGLSVSLVHPGRGFEVDRADTRRTSVRIRLTNRSALLLLTILALVLNLPAIARRDWLPASGPGSDLWLTHWGNAAYLKTASQRVASLPLWNTQTMSGRPLAGDPLAALFYPPMQAVHFLDLRTFFLLLLVGHLIFAGAGVYLLARYAVDLNPSPALLAGVAFMYNPRLIGHYGAGHLTMVMAVAWLPWIALGIILALRRHPVWAAPAGLALGLMILAGHPQIAFYGLLMVGGITFGVIVSAIRRNGSIGTRVASALRIIGLVAVVGVIGVLIGAALILPAREFAEASLRQDGLALNDKIALGHFARGLVGIPFQAEDPHEEVFVLGIPVLLLLPLAFRSRRRLAMGLLAAVATVAVLSVGASTPIMPFLTTHLPGFSYFRAPARIWFLAVLALTLLAGLGLDAVTRRKPGFHWLPALLIALLAINLWYVDQPLMHFHPASPGHSPLEIERAVAGVANGQRVYGVERNIRQAVLAPLGLELADGQDPLQIAPYARFMQQAGGYHYDRYALAIPPYQIYDPEWPTHQEAQPDARLLGLFNVGTVLSRHQLRDPRLVEVAKVDHTFIYRNEAVLPRAFLVPKTLGEQLRHSDADTLARHAAAGDLTPTPTTGEATVIQHEPGALTVQVTAHQAAYLLLGMPWYPGWITEVDSRRELVVPIGGVLQAVEIPPGTHQVTVDYAPASVRNGLLLSSVGLIGAAVWVALFTWRARKDRRHATHQQNDLVTTTIPRSSRS